MSELDYDIWEAHLDYEDPDYDVLEYADDRYPTGEEGEDYLTVICAGCSGSGEGMYDGTTCGACGGSGEQYEEV